MIMKRFCCLLVSCILLSYSSLSWATVEEELLALLKAKGIITQEEMDTLMKRIREREKEDHRLKAYYKDGFQVEAPDKDFSMKIGGRVQADYLTLDPDDRNDESSFSIRRARIEAQGKLYRYSRFKVQLDFGQGKDAHLKDGYIDFHYLDWARLRLGQFKEPFSLEELTSSKYIDLLERSTVVANLAPGRDIGLMLQGACPREMVGYSIGLFNGNGSNKKRDQNDDKDLALRFYLRPFKSRESFWLRGLQIAANTTVGHQSGLIKDLTVPTSNTHLVRWSEGVEGHGRRTRLGFDLAWVIGPFTLKGEYIRTEWKGVRWGEQKEDFDLYGWYITGSLFLTGEKKVYKGGAFGRLKEIKKGFDPHQGGWGAWEVVARYDTLKIDREVFDSGFGRGTDRVHSLGFGLNWYPHNMFTVKLNYVHNSYADDLEELSGDDQEDLFLTRFQLEF